MTCLENSERYRNRQQAENEGINFVAHNSFEAEVAARAISYTTVCFMGHGKYDRRDYDTYEDALAGAPTHRAACGKGVLVYAICHRGFTALIATVPQHNARNRSRR